MPRLSAGLLMYRIKGGTTEVLLAHPGGPYFVKKDEGAWSVPKGEPDTEEDLLITAQREFEEETGVKPTGPFIPLKPVDIRDRMTKGPPDDRLESIHHRHDCSHCHSVGGDGLDTQAVQVENQLEGV